MRPKALLPLLLLYGCGPPPGSLELCHALCDADLRCGAIGEAQAQNCHTGCESSKPQLEDADAANDRQCKNAGDFRRQNLRCLTQECGQIDPCLQALDPTCMQR